MPVELNIVESVTELDTTVVTVVLESASEPGPAGPGVPTGGTDGQVLTKTSGVDYATAWEDPTGGGGGAPVDGTYLVTTANGTLTDEVVVGATPGGELGGTWASPTVDASHSGSTHAAVQAAAEATAAAALAAHEADTTGIHGIADTANLLDTGDIGTTVQAYDADLTTYAGITPSANVQAILAAAGYAAIRALLDLEAGTDFPSLTTFNDHSARHEDGGADEIDITGLSGTPAALTTHESDTTSVHGIADTSALALTANVQPIDSDLTAIAGLSPSNDDVVQRKAGAWTNRTMAQLIADLAALGTTFQPLDSDLTALAALTTNAAGRSILILSDPNADRIAFWDDSAGGYAHLEVGAGLSISGTSLTAAGGWTEIVKQSDESVTNNTGQLDDELFFTADSSDVYEVEGFLIFESASATPDAKYTFAEDGTTRGATIGWGVSAAGAAASGVVLNNGGFNTAEATSSPGRLVAFRGIHRGNGGNAGIWWAQNTTNATATTLKAGSVLRYRKVLNA